MNIQFSNWQLINLQDYSNAINSVSAGVAKTDTTLSSLAPFPIFFDDGNNSTAYGTWQGYDLYATGSGFLGSNPVARYVQLSTTVFNNGIFSEELYRLNGAINVINSGIYLVNGGSFSSISHLIGGVIDYSIAGTFVYTPIGNIGGGAITSASINNSSGLLTLKGSLVINDNEVITSGNITEIIYTSLSGEKFLISNTSISYTALNDLINSAGGSTDFSVIHNYFLNSTNLNGNDTITGGALDDVLNGYAGNDRLVGGLGNDTYIVNLIETGTTDAFKRVALQDSVVEGVNAGTDTLELQGSFNHLNATTLILGANLERLDASATGSSKLNLTGNSLANTLIGNAANNILDGGANEDFLFGGFGDDTYIVDLKTIGTGVTAQALLQDYVEDGSDPNILNAGGIDTLKLRGTAALTNASYIELGSNLSNIDHIDASATGATLLYLNGNSLNNYLIGNSAANRIEGRDGNDTLDGGVGADIMLGGNGDDTYVVDNAADVILDNFGFNKVQSKLAIDLNSLQFNNGQAQVYDATLTGSALVNVTGNFFNNTLVGNDGANVLDGQGGDDTMRGGKGNDTFIVRDAGDLVEENMNEGTDTVKAYLSFTLGDNIENLTLLDLASFTIVNSSGTGNTLSNTIIGSQGINFLDGRGGKDILIGGKSDDVYSVDLIKVGTGTTATLALQDTVTELAGAAEGTNDILRLYNRFGGTNNSALLANEFSINTNFTLGANLESMSAEFADDLLINLTGNALANDIVGNNTNNVLDGGAGVDSLRGGTGNDTYIVDLAAPFTQTVYNNQLGNFSTFNLQDSVIESIGEGNDTLKIRGTFSNTSPLELFAGTYINNVEGLDISLTGAAKINLTGNIDDNNLVGNATANIIIGDAGDDILDGKAGADILNGGEGDDTYVLDVVADSIINETSTSGNDTAKVAFTANLSDAKFNNIENLTLLAGALNATGDEGENELIGNDGANIIDGGAGADDMDGGKGADTYIVDIAGDEVSEQFTAAQGGGIDLVKSSVDFELDDNIENLTLTGTNSINGTGNELANTIIGNAGANEIDGDDGADIMRGGDGSDTYFVDNIKDVVTEANPNALIGGIDTVNSEISYTLGANLENLTLIDDEDINGTGNTLANTIKGNAGNNVLDGGAGADEMEGGSGNDTYLVDAKFIAGTIQTSFDDTITETALGGIDTLKLRGSTTLTQILDVAAFAGVNNNIEGLDISLLTGNAKINLVGNDNDNILIGNAAVNTITGGLGNDILDGKAGADILNGGDGDDTYVIDNVADVVLETGNDLSDSIHSTISINLNSTISATNTALKYDNIENITLLGIGSLSATGDAGDNELIGNSAANVIKGEAGDDEITGGGGNDTLIGGIGADTFVWELADKGANGRPAIDRITDFEIGELNIVVDRLDLRDLLVGESEANILNYLDVTTSTAAGVTSTEIRISNTGGFAGGTFAAAAENQHITLAGVNLLAGTNETDLIASLITQNKLIIDV